MNIIHDIFAPGTSGNDARTRILAAAASLIAREGREAATTRAIAALANVQAPTIYRLFGDKRGLLEAVMEYAFSQYVAHKATRPPHPDPVQDLRDGWDSHLAFGLRYPGLFTTASGEAESDRATVAAAGMKVLQQRIERIALAGALRVSEEQAIFLLQSSCAGALFTLLEQPEDRRELRLAQPMREAVIAAITGQPVSPCSGVTAAAVTLRASLPQTEVLSSGERLLLLELLDRIAAAPSHRPD